MEEACKTGNLAKVKYLLDKYNNIYNRRAVGIAAAFAAAVATLVAT